MMDAGRPMPSRRRLLIGGAAALAAGAAALALRPGRDRFVGDEMTPPEALAAVRKGDLLLVDIRRPDEWEATGIPEGAVPLDMRRDDFAQTLAALARTADARGIGVICARGVRSDHVSASLTEAGFSRVVDIPEGMLGSSAGPGWLDRGLPVTRP